MRELRALLAAYFERVGSYQSRALLTIVYWTAVSAAALLARVSGHRPLPNTFRRATSHWIDRAPCPRDPRSLSRQF